MALRTLFLIFGLLFLSACGDVKFSGESKPSETPPGGETVPPSGTTTPPVVVGPTGATRDVNYTVKVSPPNNKLDLLLVVDDSNSMLADNKKLAEKLGPFVLGLQSSSIDWQMCSTVTRSLLVSNAPLWGASLYWTGFTPPAGGSEWILKSGTPDIPNIINKTLDTIGAGWAGTDDERGIKSALLHVQNRTRHNCYRDDAALAMILISDEDERSVGGDKALEYYANEYKALESDDLPASLMAQVRSTFGAEKRFTFNSIVVKTGDAACQKTQDEGGAKSHFGKTYEEISRLSGGGVGSICDADFSTSLNLFKGIIQDSMGSFPIECAPSGDVTVTIAPAFVTSHSVQGESIVFDPKIPAGRQLTLKYKCPM